MEVFVQFFFISVRYAISWIVNLIKIAIILLIIIFDYDIPILHKFLQKKKLETNKKICKIDPFKGRVLWPHHVKQHC